MILKKTFMSIIFLFAAISIPSFTYSNSYAGSSDYESEAIDQNIVQKSIAEKTTKKCKKKKQLTYYLFIQDFVQSFIEIPTSNVLEDSTTISSTYLAGRAPLYNEKNEKVGTCSASFLCMQNETAIYTDIMNYLSVDNGLIISWPTPTTLINLELDSIVHSMVTECIVQASTKVGVNPFYGKKFNMIVSSQDGKIYFKLTRI